MFTTNTAGIYMPNTSSILSTQLNEFLIRLSVYTCLLFLLNIAEISADSTLPAIASTAPLEISLDSLQGNINVSVVSICYLSVS